MALLSRLFGRAPAQPAVPPANTVLIDSDIAAVLASEEIPLQPAVNTALREYIDAKAKAEINAEARGIPFWLRRESERQGDIEDELRDRVIGRRSGDEGPG